MELFSTQYGVMKHIIMLNFENMKLEFTEILEINPFFISAHPCYKKIRIESLNIPLHSANALRIFILRIK